MYEKNGEKLLPWHRFAWRMGKTLLVALGVIAAAMLLGIAGYHFVARLGWIDSILNASMILTGMGPVDPMKDTGSKLFASAYALFSGVVFLSAMGIVLAPIFHRVVHAFHIGDGKP
jgi:hypothetical protein